jgi:hypothetical protein
MQIPFQTIAQDSVHQISDALRRVTRLHDAVPLEVGSGTFWNGPIQLPKPDAVAWEDTEIDVRRVLL